MFFPCGKALYKSTDMIQYEQTLACSPATNYLKLRLNPYTCTSTPARFPSWVSQIVSPSISLPAHYPPPPPTTTHLKLLLYHFTALKYSELMSPHLLIDRLPCLSISLTLNEIDQSSFCLLFASLFSASPSSLFFWQPRPGLHLASWTTPILSKELVPYACFLSDTLEIWSLKLHSNLSMSAAGVTWDSVPPKAVRGTNKSIPRSENTGRTDLGD